MAPKLGFEAAGGMVEKFLPGASFPVLMNAVLPGVAASVALFPHRAASLRQVFSAELEKSWVQVALYALVVVGLGGLVSSLNSEFYKIYEGRAFWPRIFWHKAVVWQQRKVDRLMKKQAEVRDSDPQLYKELWYRLRIYPLKEGDPYASHPTLLGNLLSGYEEYPEDRYGMDSVFYWPRLWLVVEKDNREEIGKSWAVADGLLNLSAVSLIAAVSWALVTTVAKLASWAALTTPVHLTWPSWSWLPVANHVSMSYAAALGWLMMAYVVYRLSLSFHRNNGEIFKSLFDLYRDKLLKMTVLNPSEEQRWRATWAYLQYLMIPCPKCQNYVSIYADRCSNTEPAPCTATKTDIEAAVAEFYSSGRLVSQAVEHKSGRLRRVAKAVVQALDDDPEV